jgi:hypothetical protein
MVGSDSMIPVNSRCTVLKAHEAVTVRKRRDFTNAGGRDEHAAVDADELLRIEFGLERGQRLSQQVRLLTFVERDIIALGFDPIDRRHIDRRNMPACGDDDVFEVLRAGGDRAFRR